MPRLLDSSPLPPSHSTFVQLTRDVSFTITNESSSPNSLSSPLTLNTTFNSSTAIIVIVLLSAFFFIAFFTLCLQRCFANEASTGASSTGQGDRIYDRAPAGLGKSLIDSLPLVVFSAPKSKEEAPSVVECVVCLNEFEDNDMLRLLPKCSHSFHQECIDLWLNSHTTCPLCRRSLLDLGVEGQYTADAPHERTEVAISIELGPGLRGRSEANNQASASRFNITSPTDVGDSPIYGLLLAGSFNSQNPSGRGFRRSNSTGHSLISVVQRLPCGEQANKPPPLPPAVSLPLNRKEFRRSRSYTTLCNRRAEPSRDVDSANDDEQTESSGRESGRAFSSRHPVDTEKSSASLSRGVEARMGYGDDGSTAALSSLRRTYMRLTTMVL